LILWPLQAPFFIYFLDILDAMALRVSSTGSIVAKVIDSLSFIYGLDSPATTVFLV
jgi:hypothetical protein